MSAADHWRSQLEAWEIPAPLLAAVEDSPYSWPVELIRRRNETARHEPPTRTTDIILGLLGDHGSVLDIGAGTGRASIPLAQAGHQVTGVEKSPDMAAALREEVAAREIDYQVIETAWPTQLAGAPYDVVMAAHVVYDVAAIVPFVAAMIAHARNAVILELTDAHPWVPLGPYYRALHGLDRPAGPTVSDLVAVIEEITGRLPEVEWWNRPGGMWFESWEEIEALYARRLVLPPSRVHELRPILEPEVETVDGRKMVGSEARRLATVWWRVEAASFSPS